jgi:hypothetical protein
MRSKSFKELLSDMEGWGPGVSDLDSSSVPSLSTEEFEQVLMQVCREHCAAVAQQAGSSRSRLDLKASVMARLGSNIGGDSRNRRLSSLQLAIMELSEDVLCYIESSCDLDPAAYSAIRYLQWGMIRILVRDSQALERRDHPFRLFCEYLISRLKGYDRHAGRRADALVGFMEQLLKLVVVSSPATEEAYQSARTELLARVRAYDQDSQGFVQSLISKESGDALCTDARLMVKRVVLERLDGQRVPKILVQFLQETWAKYLYATYLVDGLESRQWKEAVDDIGILAYGLLIRDGGELRRYYDSHLSKALERFRRHSDTVFGDQGLADRFFETLHEIFSTTMEGRFPEIGDTLIVTRGQLGGNSGSAPLLSDQKRAVNSLRVGNWYHLKLEELGQRCQLIERNPEFRYCLFVNMSSIKAARLEYAEICSALQSGMLEPVDVSLVLDRAMAYATNRFTERDLRRQSKVQERENLSARADERRREEEAPRQMESQAQGREDERHREQEGARLEAEAREQQARAARAKLVGEALAQVEKLEPGGSVELIDEDQRKVDCRLGLKLKSSGKMIFVDGIGRKVSELLPEELATRIVDGSAGIVAYGATFEGSLLHVMAARRKTINGDNS